jgi:hypothetical protein
MRKLLREESTLGSAHFLHEEALQRKVYFTASTEQLSKQSMQTTQRV